MAAPQIGIEERVLAAVGAALEGWGIGIEVFRTETGYGIHDVEGGVDLYLDNVTESARRAGDGWREVVDGWVGGFFVARAEQRREPTYGELRASIRTRVLPADEQRTYAREFADGLVIALAVDGATTVQTHSDASVAAVPIPLDELYRLGQANTDAEPIDEHFQLEGDVWVLGGESFFIASKTANFPALLPAIGDAPFGVAFAPINRSLVLYTILKPDKEWMMQVGALAQRADGLVHDRDLTHPGGVLSATTFYWAPDGRVEYLARRSMLVDDEPTISVIPGPAFAEVVMQEGAER